VLDKLSGPSRQHATKHALALTQARLLALPILDVDVEGIAFQEELEVAVVLQDRMRSDLVQHAL
jgi:hypothetical protein